MLAHVAVSKFDDHLPLYRLEKMLSRQGVLVSRKTMAGWLAALAQGLRPLAQLTKQLILESGVIYHDDTPVKMLDPGMGKTKETRLWVAASGSGPPLIHFAFSTSREQKLPIDFFSGYQGAVMCDEYAGYRNIDCQTLLSCWAHARRYLENAKQLEPLFVAEALLGIAGLYKIEKESKDLSAPERQSLRLEKSQPVLEKLFRHLESKTFRPGSPVSKAQGYILGHRKGLSAYIKDGRFPIDNNVAERAIRRVAIGRKNWLFLGSENGGESAAILMTLLGSCWANQINAFTYLKDIIERLPSHPKDRLEELLAPQWIVAHPEHRLPKQN